MTMRTRKKVYRIVKTDLRPPVAACDGLYLLDEWGSRYYFYDVRNEDTDERYVTLSLPEFKEEFKGDAPKDIIQEIKTLHKKFISIKKWQ